MLQVNISQILHLLNEEMFTFETHVTVKIYENCNLSNCFSIVCCKLLLDTDGSGTIIIIKIIMVIMVIIIIIIIIKLPLIFHVV